MYVPEHFAEPRAEVLHDLIRQHPLGMLCTASGGGLDVNHLPFVLDAESGPCGVLHAHVARANPLWQELHSGDEALVVFRAEHAYISPSWYPSKHESHKQVPTWNYRVAHAYGKVAIRDDERYVRGVVARLTRIHEASQATPWKMGDSPKDYIDSMLQAIVGIEIEIIRLVGKSKLGQNKEARDIQGAAQALRRQGDAALAQAMLDAIKPPPPS